jgi:hypothetical protein
MPTASPRYTLDVQVLLDMVRLQLNWLEREMATLRQVIGQEEKPSAPRRTFKSLRGVWAGIVVSDQDFEAACITLPEDLS